MLHPVDRVLTWNEDLHHIPAWIASAVLLAGAWLASAAYEQAAPQKAVEAALQGRLGQSEVRLHAVSLHADGSLSMRPRLLCARLDSADGPVVAARFAYRSRRSANFWPNLSPLAYGISA